MPRSLAEYLAELPDPRSPRGRQYPLVGLLQLAVLAMLCGKTTLVDIAHFGRQQGASLGHALGFRNRNMPCANTFANLFRKLDPEQLETLLAALVQDHFLDPNEPIAIDGKVLRGSRHGELPGLHLLAAYAPKAAAVIGQLVVGAKTNEHKTLLRLLKILPPLNGRVVTADAAFTHRDVAEHIVAKQGDYVLYAKSNQSELKHEIAINFESASAGQFSPPRCSASGMRIAALQSGMSRKHMVAARRARSAPRPGAWLGFGRWGGRRWSRSFRWNGLVG